MRRLTLLVSMMVVMLLSMASVALAQERPGFVPGEIVAVKGDEVREIKVNERSLKGLEARAEAFEKANPGWIADVNTLYYPFATPNDTLWYYQWGMRSSMFPGAWNTTKGSSNQRVCVIDSGVQVSHPDLDGKVVSARNFVGSGTPTNGAPDDSGHGTHVAGIAAAETNNSRGVAGAGWNTSIIAAKVFNNGSAASSDIAQAINYCMNKYGTVTINMSFGTLYRNAAVQSKIEEAWNNGDFLVAAAGNSGVDSPVYYPAGYNKYVTSVAAHTPDKVRAGWSSVNSSVDITAPGVDILSTVPSNNYYTKSGTSMASPHVSGLVTLLKSQGLTQSQIRNRLYNQAKDAGFAGRDDAYGHGIMRARCSVNPSSC